MHFFLPVYPHMRSICSTERSVKRILRLSWCYSPQNEVYSEDGMILPGLWKLSINKQQQKPGTVVLAWTPVILNLWVATPLGLLNDPGVHSVPGVLTPSGLQGTVCTKGTYIQRQNTHTHKYKIFKHLYRYMYAHSCTHAHSCMHTHTQSNMIGI